MKEKNKLEKKIWYMIHLTKHLTQAQHKWNEFPQTTKITKS